MIRFCLLMALPLVSLAVPNTLNYQGRLLDSNGIPVTQAGMSMVVSIWTASAAGTKLYEENHTVNVDDGVYALQIGGGTGGTPAWDPATLFNTSSPRFVELTIQSETLAPRHELLSAPFTLQSGNADKFGGQLPTYYQRVITGSCPSGQAIKTINSNGTVVCEAVGSGSQGPQGPQGPQGNPGLACWDVVKEGTQDQCEDINVDDKHDAKDCGIVSRYINLTSLPKGVPSYFHDVETDKDYDNVSVSAGSVQVYVNGSKLRYGTDFTATDGGFMGEKDLLEAVEVSYEGNIDVYFLLEAECDEP